VSLGSPSASAESASGLTLASYSPGIIYRGQSADPTSGFAVEKQPPALHTLAPTPAAKSQPVQSTVASPNCDCMDCCDGLCCDHGHGGGRLYGSAEYLMWWVTDGHVPPLVSAGPGTLPVTQQAIPGIDGNTILFQGPLDYGTFSGARFTLGYWFDPCETCALEGRFFFLSNESANFAAASGGNPALGRPFIDQNFNVPAAELTASPGIVSGMVNVSSFSELWGAEVNLRKNVCCGCWGRFDLFGGFRYLDLKEKLNITETEVAGPNSLMFSDILPGSNVFVYDSFRTRNQFYGGQLGSQLELRRGRWFTDLRAAVALGDVHQTIDVSGTQTLVPPGGGPTQLTTGGLLALPSNIGHFTSDRFAVVPELGINVGYQITENFRVFVGYTVLYWSHVVRPGDQIDTVLDIRQIPHTIGPIPPVAQSRPIMPFRQTDFWAQGVNFGLELRF
jgi:hypothetical protein